MRVLFVVGSVLVGLAAADDVPNVRTPEANFAALLKEYEAATAEWKKISPGVTPADPAWITKYEKSPDWEFAPRFITFAEANPHDATGAEALLKVLRMGRARDKALFPYYLRARDLLTREHLQDARVVQAMLRSPFFDAGQTELYFQALLTASNDRETLARAAMALASCHESRSKIAARPYFDHPEDDAKYQASTRYLTERLDPDYIRYFRSADPVALSREREALLERVARDYGDIPQVPSWSTPELQKRGEGRTLGKLAGDKLNALRTISVGMLAPEIEGTDVDGGPLRLSDYRGKVVVLVFWGTWCGPCMGFLPTEKALAERLKDRPFVLLGVNSDKEREALKATSIAKGITWRSWFDGGSPYGPIASRWNVYGWPTIVVIDKAGVIRFKDLSHHTPQPLNDAVDTLLEEK
ncbi:TlpA disulfide reductase family protein [Singulisphaera sp. Ch08]|uniref:TlpA disulfide reductase family protein n=1 Tax=Singulisphaera sp. Ch08 TaxID=3120278 RepID=A0AAU7C8N3_9BACT